MNKTLFIAIILAGCLRCSLPQEEARKSASFISWIGFSQLEQAVKRARITYLHAFGGSFARPADRAGDSFALPADRAGDSPALTEGTAPLRSRL